MSNPSCRRCGALVDAAAAAAAADAAGAGGGANTQRITYIYLYRLLFDDVSNFLMFFSQKSHPGNVDLYYKIFVTFQRQTLAYFAFETSKDS